jgi:hypothetical protein
VTVITGNSNRPQPTPTVAQVRSRSLMFQVGCSLAPNENVDTEGDSMVAVGEIEFALSGWASPPGGMLST